MTAKRTKLIIISLILSVVAIGIPGSAFIISENTTLSIMESVSMLGTVGTVALSGILAYLYLDIRNIQANQEELMSVQYEPEIKATISSGNNEYPVILIKNTGMATALELEVNLFYENEKKTGRHPFLGSGETIEYPIYTDGAPLSADEIIDRMSVDSKKESSGPFESDIDEIGETLICAISCRDVKNDIHGFEETFELKSSLAQLEDYKRRSEVDALEQISAVLEDVNDELKEANNDLL
jgi:hypothetical protein